MIAAAASLVAGAAPRRRQASSWLVQCLVLGSVATALSLGANLLTWAGSRYVSEGGVLPEKLHPASYLAFAAAGLALLDRAARGEATDWLWRQRRLTLFLTATTGCVALALLFTGVSNLIVLLDNFLAAGCLGLAAAEARPLARRRLRTLLQAGFAGNAALAIGEALAGAHLLPLYLNGEAASELAADFRPLALYDHPLTGAAATLIGFFLARGPGRSLGRAAYVALLAAGLVAFGGRVALLVASLAASLPVAARIREVFARRRVSGWAVAMGLAAAIAASTVLIVGLSAGVGSRVVAHGLWDASAATRLDEWRILLELDPAEWLFGAKRADLLDHLETLRLDRGVGVIENPALLMFTSLGLCGFALFATGFAALLAWAWQRSPRAGRVLTACFLVTISASNSLGRKSPLLLLFVAAIVALEPRRPVPAR